MSSRLSRERVVEGSFFTTTAKRNNKNLLQSEMLKKEALRAQPGTTRQLS
jgi:hypothetical protein